VLLFAADCIASFLDQFLGRAGSSLRSIDHLAPWMNVLVDPYFLPFWFIGVDEWMQS
jgi:hypothetical protein